MQPSNLLHYASRKPQSGDQPLWYGRSGEDGMPFRGERDPQLTAAEWETRTVQIAEAHNDFFDVTVPEQNRAFLLVLDAAANQWFRVLHIERFWRGTTKHYVEWLEYYREDGTRQRLQPPAADFGDPGGAPYGQGHGAAGA